MPTRSQTTTILSSILFAAICAGTAQAQPTPAPAAGAPAAPAEAAPAAEAAAEAPPVEAPPAETKPAEPAAPVAPPPANPTKLGAGKTGFFTPAILFQGWYTVDRSNGVTTDAFKLRRAEFHAKGQIIPDKVQYEINVDFAKVLETAKVTVPTTPTVDINNPQSKISALQDLYLTYLTKNAEISLGQHKIPVSWEGVNSSGKLLFVERSAVSKQFGDIRDIGLRVTKAFPKFMYMAGVYNGTGLNQPENNPGKDVSLRLEVYPVKGLTLAAVTYDSVFDRKQPTAKDRWEIDARYEKDAILVQAEAIIARDYAKAGVLTKGQGAYAAFAYKLPNNLQPAIRVGALDTNTDADGTATDTRLLHIDVGANYYLQDHNAKLQAVFTRTMFKADGKAADNLLLLAGQVYY